MTTHCSGMSIGAEQHIADGVREMIQAHISGRPLPSDYVLVDASVS